MPTDIQELIETTARTWSGVVPPNAAGTEMAGGLAAIIASFETLRGSLLFEDEPASFAAALQSCKE